MSGNNVCQVVSLVKSTNNLHPRRRKRLIHFLRDKGIAQSPVTGSIVIGGTSVSIAGVESLDQIKITFADMKRYDLDFLTPIDATQEQVDAWKEERRRNNAAERQSKSRAKRREAHDKELAARLEADAKREQDLIAEAVAKFEKLTLRAKEALRIILVDRIWDAPAIAKEAAKSAAFKRVGSVSVCWARDPGRDTRRALRTLEKAGFVTLTRKDHWQRPMIKAWPTALADALRANKLCVNTAATPPGHTMPQWRVRTEIVEEIPMTPVTLSKDVTNEKTVICLEAGNADVKATLHDDPVATPITEVPFKRKEVI